MAEAEARELVVRPPARASKRQTGKMAETEARELVPGPQARPSKRKATEDIEAVKADVASFAASLGLAATAGGGSNSGFDDSDFRKKGSIRKDGRGGLDSGEDRSEGLYGKATETKKKKKKKKEKREGLVGLEPSKVKEDRNSRLKEDVSEDEDDVKTDSGKRKGSGGAILPNKAAKGGAQANPAKSKIHEVLDGGLMLNPKKSEGEWVDHRGDDIAGYSRSTSVGHGGAPESHRLQTLRVEAQQLLEKLVQNHERSRHKDRDAHWLNLARRSGTSADKVAAMTVMLQDNPKANVRTLDALIGMLTSKAGKRHAATGIDALRELFIVSFLPDRKLKYFQQQPFATLPETKERGSVLLDWYWEDCLKRRYENFVRALEDATKDTLSFLKDKAVKTVYELLKAKPEQERRLLSLLVNKLGDPDRKMASNASYLLSSLLTTHPNMKKVVVDEVEAFVFRRHVGLRARYYAAIFLNQIAHTIRGDGPHLAKQLIDLYFALFKAVTSVVDEDNNEKKGKDDNPRSKHLQKKGKLQGSVKATEIEKSANFTMEIDSRLLSALLSGVNRALPYIRMEDLDSVAQENTVLFRLVHSTNFNVAVQALMLLHQLLTKSQAISDRFYRALYSVLLSKSLVKSSKADMFLGLMFKALKSDIDSRRMSAFAKRLAQVAMHQPPQFACGSLLLLSEILKTKPILWNSILQPEMHDDEEHFDDVKDDMDAVIVDEDNLNRVVDRQANEDDRSKDSYDPKHRDPLYCNAHRACWWELSVLACHVHPSVATMARTLLSGANIVYNGDPLRDFAFGAFLDRFTEKKPKPLKLKEAGTWHGSSLSLPSRMAGVSASERPSGEEFSSLAEDQVAPEDLMFHKFYAGKSKMGTRKPKKKRKDEDEDEATDGILGEDDKVMGDDDSEDEEIDALLEQEGDVEMDDGGRGWDGVSEGDEDDVSLDQEDDSEDGSEMNASEGGDDDDSGDENDEDAEDGIEVDASEDSDEESGANGVRADSRSSKRKGIKMPSGSKRSVFQEAPSESD